MHKVSLIDRRKVVAGVVVLLVMIASGCKTLDIGKGGFSFVSDPHDDGSAYDRKIDWDNKFIERFDSFSKDLNLTGTFFLNSSKGVKVLEIGYYNGLREGRVVYFAANDGRQLCIESYLKGALYTKTDYWDNGKIAEYTEYRDGDRSGFFRRLNKDGVVVLEGKYFKGKKDGKWTLYHPCIRPSENRPRGHRKVYHPEA